MHFPSSSHFVALALSFASLQPSLALPRGHGISVLSSPDFSLKLAPRDAAKSSAQTCAKLSQKFSSGETYTPGEANYTSLYQEPWSQTSWLPPSCIGTPSTEQELSEVLSIITADGTKFAVRSGGHNFEPGFSSIKDGVLVSLERFNRLELSADRKSMVVGSGNRWGSVYKYTAQFGLTVVGGREPPVGVGGFLLGGGLGVFYNTYGLGLDNILRYNVMLTNGTAVNATQTENADLYRALKGGLTNFGIVMEFELVTVATTDTTFGLFFYSPNNTEAVLRAYTDYLISNPDSQTNVELAITRNSTLAFMGKVGHTGDLSAFKAFDAIPKLNTAIPFTNGSINDITIGIGGQDRSIGSSYGSVFSHKVLDANFFIDSYRTYLKAVATMPAGASLTYSPQGITKSLVEAGRSKFGGNILGLSDEPQAWINIFSGYADNKQTAAVKKVVDGYSNSMDQKARAQGISIPYIYPNDASASQNVLASFGRSNVDFIRKIAKKYDPKGVMQRLQNDGYLVSKVY